MKRITIIILTVAATVSGSISCQKVNEIDKNPLSMVNLSIIPDYSDGSVYSCSEGGSFFLRVSVKPEKYIEKLSDKDGLICKADFRSVITKAAPENPDFSVVGEITSASVEEGYIVIYFNLAEDGVAKLQMSDYVVSFSIEDTDGVHGASTSYVSLSNPREGKGGDEIPEGALPGVFSVSPTKMVYFSKGNLQATVDASGNPTGWKFAENQYDCLGEGGANETIGTKAGDVDLFGWSTPRTAFGISNSTSNEQYYGDFNDWGKAYCEQEGLEYNIWRTLTREKWRFLCEGRKFKGGYGQGEVNSYSYKSPL